MGNLVDIKSQCIHNLYTYNEYNDIATGLHST